MAWLGLAGLALLTLARPLLSVHAHPHIDEGIYAYMAAGPAATGLPLYAASFENKPPVFLGMYQVVHAYGRDTLWRARLVEGFLLLGGALLLLVWLGTEVSAAAGWLAAFTFVLLMNLTPAPYALTEPPLAVFALAGMVAAYYAYRRGRLGGWLLAGVCLGLASSFKQTAVLDMLALLLAAGWWLRRAPRRLAGAGALVLVGFGLVWALIWGWLALTGQFAVAWQSVVASVAAGDTSASLGIALRRSLGFSLWALPFTGALWALAACEAVLRPAAGGPPGEGGWELRGQLWIWLAAGVIGMAAEGSFLVHQAAQFWAPLAGLAAIGYVTLAGAAPIRPRLRTAALVLLLLAVVPLTVRFGWMAHQQVAHHLEADDLAEESIAQDLTGWMPPPEKMYVVGGFADIYLDSGRRAPTRFFESLLLRTPAEQQAVVTELERELPGAVVVAPWQFSYQQDFQRLVERELLAGRYVHVRDWLRGRFQLYLRADLAARAFPQGPPADLEAPGQVRPQPPRAEGFRQRWRRLTGGRAR